MKHDFEQPPFSRHLLIGVLAGVMAVLANIALDFIFRSATGFTNSVYLNISNIIFGSVIPITLGGIIYSILQKYKGGTIIYMIVFLSISLFLAFKASALLTDGNVQTNHQFHELFVGMIAIIGTIATFGVPYFATHKKVTEGFI